MCAGLRLKGPDLLKLLLFACLHEAFMTSCITKAMPIHFIDGDCYTKQLNSVKLVKPITQGLYHTTGY